mmetsp:Transcript_114113/g.285480  ORF Transcript_114113/g.285480 Transcript_114113/m.285480 type:complete len:243 (-) Transcript_114113:64-792(-)
MPQSMSSVGGGAWRPNAGLIWQATSSLNRLRRTPLTDAQLLHPLPFEHLAQPKRHKPMPTGARLKLACSLTWQTEYMTESSYVELDCSLKFHSSDAIHVMPCNEYVVTITSEHALSRRTDFIKHSDANCAESEKVCPPDSSATTLPSLSLGFTDTSSGSSWSNLVIKTLPSLFLGRLIFKVVSHKPSTLRLLQLGGSAFTTDAPPCPPYFDVESNRHWRSLILKCFSSAPPASICNTPRKWR